MSPGVHVAAQQAGVAGHGLGVHRRRPLLGGPAPTPPPHLSIHGVVTQQLHLALQLLKLSLALSPVALLGLQASARLRGIGSGAQGRPPPGGARAKRACHPASRASAAGPPTHLLVLLLLPRIASAALLRLRGLAQHVQRLVAAGGHG